MSSMKLRRALGRERRDRKNNGWDFRWGQWERRSKKKKTGRRKGITETGGKK